MPSCKARKQARLALGDSSMPAPRSLIASPPTGLNVGLPLQNKTKGKNAWVWEQYAKKQAQTLITDKQKEFAAWLDTVRSAEEEQQQQQEGEGSG
eukprot:105610-Pelagomonas_calceolata.AAC.3